MKNFSLKYLIIGVALLSAVIIVGALLLNQVSQKPTASPPPEPAPKGINPATGGESSPASTPNLPKPVPKPQPIK